MTPAGSYRGGRGTASGRRGDVDWSAVLYGRLREAGEWNAAQVPLAGFEEALTRLLHLPGPALLVARVEPGNPEARPPMDCVFIKTRFMGGLGSA